jgi:hypothetical protein
MGLGPGGRGAEADLGFRNQRKRDRRRPRAGMRKEEEDIGEDGGKGRRRGKQKWHSFRWSAF